MEEKMKPIRDLELGFADAENYKRRENKAFLNRVFIRDAHLDELCQPNVSFLIGEKGTGKTAYSIFLTNNNYNNTLASTRGSSGFKGISKSNEKDRLII
jgi:polynucleotide 5'-kinase involved in rRNA processing